MTMHEIILSSLQFSARFHSEEAAKWEKSVKEAQIAIPALVPRWVQKAVHHRLEAEKYQSVLDAMEGVE